MPTCPSGHQSGSDDWCEVCGLRIAAAPTPGRAGAGSAPPPADPDAARAASEPTVAVEACPNCGTLREDREMFCEECRYNFVTRSATPFAAPPAVPPFTGPPFPPPYERTSSRPSQMNRMAEPLPPDATITGDQAGIGPGRHDDDFVLPPPGLHREPGAGTPPQQPAEGTWTAVVTADREYYTAMMARSGPNAAQLYFPTYSPELLVPLHGERITVGRRRHSTGESPDIDLSRPPEDPGVSHLHAVLVRRSDGGWAVVDLDSTNGTTVNHGDQPIAPHQPVDLAAGDRVHVGAWTTITLHRG